MRRFLQKLFLTVNIAFCHNVLAQDFDSTKNIDYKPTISVEGFIDNNAGFVDDSLVGSAKYQNKNLNFINNSEIHLKLNGIDKFGMKYGADVELETAASTYNGGQGYNIDKGYIFSESNSGRFEVGNNLGANQKMKVGAANLARGAGGINGKYLEYINLPILVNSAQGANKIGNCDGLNIAGGSVSMVGSDCANIKLPRFILLPQSPISQGGYAQSFYNKASDNNYTIRDEVGFNKKSDVSIGTLETATKISYYSPRISGLQLGVSFTPNTGNSGGDTYFSGNVDNDLKNVISWGLNYSNNFDNIGFAMSITGENGQIEQNNIDEFKRNNLNAYDIGMMTSYFGFTFGASYGNWGDSLMPKEGIYSCKYNANMNISLQNCDAINDRRFSDASYYTLGLSYKIGPIALSATHLASEFQNNEYMADSIGLDYKISKGLMPYLELTKFNFKSDEVRALDVLNQTDKTTNQIRDNKGYVLLTGIMLSF